MGSTPPAGISKIDILEGDGREERVGSPAPIGTLRRNQWFGGEERVDADGGGLSEDPLMQQIRYLDKLVDELAKGKALDKVLRSSSPR